MKPNGETWPATWSSAEPPTAAKAPHIKQGGHANRREVVPDPDRQGIASGHANRDDRFGRCEDGRCLVNAQLPPDLYAEVVSNRPDHGERCIDEHEQEQTGPVRREEQPPRGVVHRIALPSELAVGLIGRRRRLEEPDRDKRGGKNISPTSIGIWYSPTPTFPAATGRPISRRPPTR